MYVYISVGWKVHMIASYLPLMNFLTNGIQAVQHCWKKFVDNKGNYVEK